MLVVCLVLPCVLFSETADDLFRDGSLHDVYLEMRAEDWRSLRDNYLEDTKYEATFVWNTVRFSRVSVRSRGSGSRDPLKPSLKIDFDNYVKDQTFGELKSLVFDNNIQDLSQVKERVTMKLMRELGLPAPRESSARLVVNGQFVGVYTLVEPVDKPFLKSRFGENKGTLYEFNKTDPWFFNDLGSDPSKYAPKMFEPKTNEDKPQVEKLIEFVQAVNRASDAEFRDTLARYVDTDQLLLYIAIQQYLAEVDGFNGWNGTNNFYLYQTAVDAPRFTFIPWDDDLTFHDASWSAIYNFDANVITRRMWADPVLRPKYLAIVQKVGEFAGGSNGWLVSEVDLAYRQVSSAVFADPSNGCMEEALDGVCPVGKSMFDESAEAVRSFAENRYGALAHELEYWHDYLAMVQQ
jgi:spore coat protein CotH